MDYSRLFFKFCHRDLALRNFLVTEHYLVKIADFGLAKQAIGVYIVSHPVRTFFSSSKNDAQCTNFLKCPTPREIAPEALREGIFTERSDVYSFGLSLAFLYNLSVDVEVIERARNLQSIAKPILADNEL